MASFRTNQKLKNIKPLINVGACLDLPSGEILEGFKGEAFYNAGIGPSVAITGPGNSFKSTLCHYLIMSASSKIAQTAKGTEVLTYDTEESIKIARLEELSRKFKGLDNQPITGEEPIWFVSDSNGEAPEEWTSNVMDYIERKEKDKEELVEFQCFKDCYTKSPLKDYRPTFIEIDSFSAMTFDTVIEGLKEGIGDSGNNAFAMKNGNLKSRFVSLMPQLSSSTNTHFVFTMHLGNNNALMDKYNAPKKQLGLMKQNEKIKGISENITFLVYQCYKIVGTKVLQNDSTKKEEFPKSGTIYPAGDLNLMNLTILRSKSGPSGGEIGLVVSQTDGLLPGLTEFYNIKTHGRFGLEGNDRFYNLSLYPSIKLERTKIRDTIDNDPLFARALNFTSELLQLELYHNQTLKKMYGEDIFCTPKELYEDLIKAGYDWNTLLNTRGYWTINQYEHEVPFLSAVDLLRMRKGIYTPYWYKK